MWAAVVVPLSAGTSHTAPWPEDALTGSVLRPRSFSLQFERLRRRTFSPTYARGIAEPHHTHYDTLGVGAGASASEIRAAYLRRARELHPDVQHVAVADQPSMAELNRAYQVLGRDATRREYDRALAAPTAPDENIIDDVDEDADEFVPSPGSRTMTRVLTPSGPPRMPWKLMGVAALIGTVAVFASAAFADPPAEETPDGILRVGSCVTIESNGDAREVACGGDDQLVVALVLPTGSTCPPAYATHRDRLGLGTVCVEPTT